MVLTTWEFSIIYFAINSQHKKTEQTGPVQKSGKSHLGVASSQISDNRISQSDWSERKSNQVTYGQV